MESIRKGYIENGVDNFYKLHKNNYSNPHKEKIQKLLLFAKENWNLGDNILDLCCGSGEVTEVFEDKNIEGIDPYTYDLYRKNTNKPCESKTFKDIVENGLDKKYDCIISSFALHLCEESMLPILLYRLGESTNKLLIITPHKRPECNNIYGWQLTHIKKENKITMKLYKRD